jgi:hypothetical protein
MNIANASEVSWIDRLWRFQFGAFTTTAIYCWADSIDEGLEVCAAWLFDHSPGHLIQMGDPELSELIEGVLPDGETISSWQAAFRSGSNHDQSWACEVEQEAFADLTYTDSGYLTSYEWWVDEVDDPAEYNRVKLACIVEQLPGAREVTESLVVKLCTVSSFAIDLDTFFQFPHTVGMDQGIAGGKAATAPPGQTEDTSVIARGDLGPIACRAAIELDNLLLGEGVTRVALQRLSKLLSSFIEAGDPPRPVLQEHPAALVVIKGAIGDARIAQQELATIDELLATARSLTERLVNVTDNADIVCKDELQQLKQFCLALSRSASRHGQSAED